MPSERAWAVRGAGPGDDEAVSTLYGEYLSWASDQLAREYGIDFRPARPARIGESLDHFRHPAGRLLLVEQQGIPMGTAAIRTIASGVGEIKRMYVRPELRGRGAGGALLDGLLAAAGSLGLVTVRLDTARFMQRAQALYRSRGFAERPAYPESEIPPDLQQHWIFFEHHVAATVATGVQVTGSGG